MAAVAGFGTVLNFAGTMRQGQAESSAVRSAGKQDAAEIRHQAAMEGRLAKQQEIERRRSLLRALASQNASIGAAGISGAGSAGNLMAVDAKRFDEDMVVSRSNNVINQELQKYRALERERTAGKASRAIKQASYFKAASSILGGFGGK